MPTAIRPMLAELADKPFDNSDWLFEIKWDGYRAIAFSDGGSLRLVSRTQNDLTAQFSELQELPRAIKARTAILDGEIVALDEEGRPSFGLMQQRTGIRAGGRRGAKRSELSVFYYAFDLLYLNGYDIRRAPLELRKQTLTQILTPSPIVRYSEHFPQGVRLFEAARVKGLEGIVAKRRNSCYEERRSRDWIKIKITQTVDCVVGGYTDPEGSRQYFGSLALGLYDTKRQLIHVGQVGTGFDHKKLRDVFQLLQKRRSASTPFHGQVEARNVHWIKPDLVAEVRFTEWTHETSIGGVKLRAPVFVMLREDKKAEECNFDSQSKSRS